MKSGVDTLRGLAIAGAALALACVISPVSWGWFGPVFPEYNIVLSGLFFGVSAFLAYRAWMVRRSFAPSTVRNRWAQWMWFGFVAGVMNLGLVSLAMQASSMHDQRPVHLVIVLMVQIGVLGALRAVRAQPKAPRGTLPTDNSANPPLTS